MKASDLKKVPNLKMNVQNLLEQLTMDGTNIPVAQRFCDIGLSFIVKTCLPDNEVIYSYWKQNEWHLWVDQKDCINDIKLLLQRLTGDYSEVNWEKTQSQRNKNNSWDKVFRLAAIAQEHEINEDAITIIQQGILCSRKELKKSANSYKQKISLDFKLELPDILGVKRLKEAYRDLNSRFLLLKTIKDVETLAVRIKLNKAYIKDLIYLYAAWQIEFELNGFKQTSKKIDLILKLNKDKECPTLEFIQAACNGDQDIKKKDTPVKPTVFTREKLLELYNQE